MRVAFGQLRAVTDELASFALQLGVTSVHLNTPDLPVEAGFWQLADLKRLKHECSDRGLTLEAIENVPMSLMLDFLLGTVDAERALDNYCRTIDNLGAAGIPTLGYHFMPSFVWRTDVAAEGRGGARVTAYDDTKQSSGNKILYPQADPTTLLVRDDLWRNYERFLARVLPVADSAGVQLALHPDDPPVSVIGRTDRLFATVDDLVLAEAMADGNPAWKLDLCLGSISSMASPDALEMAVRHFGNTGNIAYVHFRDVNGRVPQFTETFVNDGNYDSVRLMGLLAETGFDGFVIDDHVPAMSGDNEWGARAHAHAIGYLQALVASTIRERPC